MFQVQILTAIGKTSIRLVLTTELDYFVVRFFFWLLWEITQNIFTTHNFLVQITHMSCKRSANELMIPIPLKTNFFHWTKVLQLTQIFKQWRFHINLVFDELWPNQGSPGTQIGPWIVFKQHDEQTTATVFATVYSNSKHVHVGRRQEKRQSWLMSFPGKLVSAEC